MEHECVGETGNVSVDFFFLLLKTSIACFRVCVTGTVPSQDPINLGPELLSALSGTLISASDEGEGGQQIFFFIPEMTRILSEESPEWWL